MHAPDDRVDADHLAVNIDQWAAAVAGVDACVGLDEILIQHDAIGKDPAALGADVAERDAVVQLEGRADGDGEFAHPSFGGISQFRHGQVLRLDPDHGHV